MIADDFYVYEHRTADTGKPFYIGKGRRDRAFRTSQRNPYWNRIVAKHGLTVHFIAEGLPEELALLCEIEAIDLRRRQGIDLANMTSGGDGARLSPEDEARRVAAMRAFSASPSGQAHMRKLRALVLASPALIKRRNASIAAAHRQPAARESASLRLRTLLKTAPPDHPMLWPRSDEGRRKMHETRYRRPVVCLDRWMVFPSLKDARDWLVEQGHEHAQSIHIRRACLEPHRRTYGHSWAYLPMAER